MKRCAIFSSENQVYTIYIYVDSGGGGEQLLITVC